MFLARKFRSVCSHHPLLSHNLLTASYMGGGIEVQDEAKLQIEDSLFLDNVAVFYGASISIMFSSLRMLRTHSEANRCEIEGGVIESIFSNVEIFDCTFKSNSGKSGGVIACLSNSTCYSTNNQYVLNRVRLIIISFVPDPIPRLPTVACSSSVSALGYLTLISLSQIWLHQEGLCMGQTS